MKTKLELNHLITFAVIRAYFDTNPHKDNKKVDRNTYIEKRGDDYALRLHKTDIVTFKKNGDRVLSSGGWRTPTTKDRINSAGFRISQIAGVWYLSGQLFQDGIIVTKRNKIKNAAPKGAVKKMAVMTDKIKQYAVGFAKALEDGKVPQPSAGDCWMCALKDKEGKAMGDGDHSHLLEHMKEKYFVPSLLVNAFNDGGACKISKSVVMQLMNGEQVNHWKELALSDVKKYIVRYFKKRMGIAGK